VDADEYPEYGEDLASMDSEERERAFFGDDFLEQMNQEPQKDVMSMTLQ